MPHFFIILLKINLVLALFSVAYYLVLRRLTYYTLNRVFLVLGMLFATVYPFYRFNSIVPSTRYECARICAST